MTVGHIWLTGGGPPFFRRITGRQVRLFRQFCEQVDAALPGKFDEVDQDPVLVQSFTAPNRGGSVLHCAPWPPR